MSVKALGIALKLTLEGSNQFIYFQTWIFTVVVAGCCLLQINYLNKVLNFSYKDCQSAKLVILIAKFSITPFNTIIWFGITSENYFLANFLSRGELQVCSIEYFF